MDGTFFTLRLYFCVAFLVLCRACGDIDCAAKLEAPDETSHVQVKKILHSEGRAQAFRFAWHQGRHGVVPVSLQLSRSCELPNALTARMRPEPKNGKKWMDAMVDFFQSDEPFSMVRFGDGEWMCALGYGMQRNSDGATLRGDVCSRLRDNILQYGGSGAPDDVNFFPVVGTFFICKQTHEETFDAVDKFLQNHHLQSKFDGFVNDFYFPLFPDSEQAKNSERVLPRLVNKDVVVVGPRHLRNLRASLNNTDFIEVQTDAWIDKDRILKAIGQASSKRAGVNVKFLVAAGPSANVLVYEAWKKHGQKDTFIDVGATLDGYAGQESRQYNSKTEICGNAVLSKYAAPGVCE